jgi:drug/metabolite transporter (DMT)-like permease
MLSSLQFFIVLSCLISVSVNFSTFLVIGKTSAVTYQVLGHLKTCLVLAFGYFLLHDPFRWRNILGISIAVVGMGLYSYCCTIESQQKANEASAPLAQVVQFYTLIYARVFIIFRLLLMKKIRQKLDLPPPKGLCLYSLSLNSTHLIFLLFCHTCFISLYSYNPVVLFACAMNILNLFIFALGKGK